MSVVSDWFIGSIANMALQTVQINGGDQTFTAGNWYLRDTSAGRSLVDRIATMMTSAGETPTVYIGLDRKLRITSTTTFSWTWGSATTAKALLGFTGSDHGSGTTYTANEPSPLLFSASYPATTATIPNVDGYEMDDVIITPSADFSQQLTDFFNTGTFQEFDFSEVPIARTRVATGSGGGTFYQFWRQVLVPGYRFHWYESVTEDDAVTTAVTWPSGTSKHGPYKRRKHEARWFKRTIKNSNDLAEFGFDGVKVSEYA